MPQHVTVTLSPGLGLLQRPRGLKALSAVVPAPPLPPAPASPGHRWPLPVGDRPGPIYCPTLPSLLSPPCMDALAGVPSYLRPPATQQVWPQAPIAGGAQPAPTPSGDRGASTSPAALPGPTADARVNSKARLELTSSVPHCCPTWSPRAPPPLLPLHPHEHLAHERGAQQAHTDAEIRGRNHTTHSWGGRRLQPFGQQSPVVAQGKMTALLCEGLSQQAPFSVLESGHVCIHHTE